MAVEVGQQAPDFELKDQHGQPVKLSGFRGQKSDSRPNSKPCCSAQTRCTHVESTDTVSSSTSSRPASGKSSRMAHSSPLHTPLNASG